MQISWENCFKPFTLKNSENKHESISNSAYCIFLFMLLGFIATVASINEAKSTIFNKTNLAHKQKILKIKESIQSLEQSNNILESELIVLNHRFNKKFKTRGQEEISRLSYLLGQQAYIGPGIVIRLSDNDKPIKDPHNTNLGIIHNVDLLKIVNNLWSNSAKAISINNQRITMNTEISCVGPIILINKTRVTSPFEIKVAGDPEKLMDSLKNKHMDILSSYGVKFYIDKFNRIEIPSGGTMILAGEN